MKFFMCPASDEKYPTNKNVQFFNVIGATLYNGSEEIDLNIFSVNDDDELVTTLLGYEHLDTKEYKIYNFYAIDLNFTGPLFCGQGQIFYIDWDHSEPVAFSDFLEILESKKFRYVQAND